MINLFISIIYLIITFLITVLFYKKYGRVGLYIWMCTLVIICNIQTVKLSEIFGLTISLGNISYGALFLTTDILSEKYGERITNEAIKLSSIVMCIFALCMYLFLQYKPSSIDSSQKALLTIFNYVPRITIGSLMAYYISQHCDTFLYKKAKEKFGKVWISNNVSTFLSQIVDTLIFVSISFLGLLPIEEIFNLIITMIIFKWIIAILDTPFMIIVAKIKNNKELYEVK